LERGKEVKEKQPRVAEETEQKGGHKVLSDPGSNQVRRKARGSVLHGPSVKIQNTIGSSFKKPRAQRTQLKTKQKGK